MSKPLAACELQLDPSHADTPPCTEPAVWRKFPARVHADAGVELEIFRRAGSLRGVICGAKTRGDSSRQRETTSAPRSYEERFSEEPAFIPFPASDAVDTFEISPYTISAGLSRIAHSA